MKIISYSDLHLEFGKDFMPPQDTDADLMILAGDIITFRDYRPLHRLLSDWHKPALFIAGNHEYYMHSPMNEENNRFKEWLLKEHPNVIFLQNEAVTIDQVHFFGGTMWTDFYGRSEKAMSDAQAQMNDYRLIRKAYGEQLTPSHTVDMHEVFLGKIRHWFKEDLAGPRVVVTHHAPVVNPKTKYGNSPLMPAFNSLDMVELIENYQPDLWVYGHTHECDNHLLGRTRIISNQSGYPDRTGTYECSDFDERGLPITL